MANVGGRRSWVRQGLILEEVRSRIIKGEWGPGARVPTRDELERRFRASRVTIQRAFDALIQEGFVEPRGRLGTFVSVTPPHLYRYVLAFPLPGETPSRRSSFEQALLREARAVTRKGPRELGIFGGVRRPGDLARFQVLDEDVSCNRVGGVIFVGEPDGYEGSRLLTTRHFPRVSLSRTGTPRHIPRVELDGEAFFEQALRLARPRRRAALLSSRWEGDEDAASFGDALGKTGMVSEPRWVHRVDVGEASACRSLAELLMQGPKALRPDLLILTEELLLPNLLDGLTDAGIDPARDLTVIVRSFRRGGTPSLAPAIALGYDLRELLATCFSLLEAQRAPGADITPIAGRRVGIRR